jgi:hypothetical protein
MYGILFFNLHTLFSTKFSIMLFFHLPYRKLTSNIENSKYSFEKTKSPPVIFPPLILLPIPARPLFNFNSLKNSQILNKKAFTQRWIPTKLQTKSEFLIKKSKTFLFIQYIFFGSRMRKLLFSPFSVDQVSVHHTN